LAFQNGARPPGPSSPGADENERQPLTAEDLGLAAIEWGAGARPPQADDAGLELPILFAGLELPILFAELALGAGPAARFAVSQVPVIARARDMVAAGATLVRMRLPTGFGKSYVILELAGGHRAAGAVAVIAPRSEIVAQLVGLAADRGWARVIAVGGGTPWPAELGAGDLVVSTGQSVKTLGGRRAQLAALFVDEAHSHEGHGACLALVHSPVRYELSACLEGKTDIEISHREAVDHGLICQAQFAFDVYPRQPTFDDIAAELAARPEHACVLACFQTRASARGFAAACARSGVDAATFVGDDPRTALDKFRAGARRVLCVVGRVEMGANIHRCDTVLFVEPWVSWKRDLQLIGRGVRLHPTKPGFFSVLCPVGPEDIIERRLAFLVETLHANYDAFDPRTFDEVEDLVEFRAAAGAEPTPPIKVEPAAFDVLAAARRELYDAVGRRINEPLFIARVLYARARELIAAADPPLETCIEYAAWRAHHPTATDLPDDPAAAFNALGFSWDEFLGLEPLPADFAETLKAAARELASKGVKVGSALAGNPAAPFYARLRSTAAGRSLPANPLRGDGLWASVFAMLR
jgi:hypothetical protein